MLTVAAWLLLAAIHLTPAVALVAPNLVTRLYGLAPGGELFLLMRHRAALFAVIVLICVWAAIDPSVRRLGTVAVAISMLGFLALYAGAGAPVGSLRTIALADLIGVPALAWVAWTAFRDVAHA